MMLISTGSFPPSGTQELGFVYGSSCLSSNVLKDTAAMVRNATIGGDLKQYRSLMDKGLEMSLDRMKDMAAELGADGVYGVRIATPQVAGGAAEIIAYGTAFKYLV